MESLSPKTFEGLLNGDGTDFVGVLGMLDREFAGASSAAALERWEKYRGVVHCPACQGARLRARGAARHDRGAGDSRSHASYGRGARGFFADLAFPTTMAEVGATLVAQMLSRLEFLANVGLNYLTLDRAADSLSGGELQRIRLASSIGSGLVGVCYVLDEPSIGLHPRDNDRLIRACATSSNMGIASSWSSMTRQSCGPRII